MCLKCFIYAENKTGLISAEAQIEPYVYITFEFPTITDAVVRENMSQTYVGKTRKNRAGANPGDRSVAAPDVLPKFDTGVDLAFVTIAALEVSTHVVASAECRQQPPRRVAVSQSGM